MVKKIARAESSLEKLSFKFTSWVGTPLSVIVHTIIFLLFTLLVVLGADFNKVMLIWNTSVSLEAIYLALFIQMTVNRQSASLKSVEEDIDEIQEDVEDLQEDVEDIQEGDQEDSKRDKATVQTLDTIEIGLQKLLSEVEELKKRNETRSL